MDGLKYKTSEKGYALPIEKFDDEVSVGLIQRSVKELLTAIQPLRQAKNVQLTVSFLQIYNEKIYDLLNPGMFKRNKADGLNQPAFYSGAGGGNSDPAGLKLKWNPFDVYTVENLYNFTCHTEEEIMKLFFFGVRQKVVGSHKMNLTSSRSHTIFSITIE